MRRLDQLQRLVLLGLLGPVLALNAWLLLQVFHYFQTTLTILVAAGLLAFLLHYPLHIFRRLGLRQGEAVAVVFLVALLGLVLLWLTLVPIVADQTVQFLERLPALIQSGEQQISGLDAWANRSRLPVDLGRLNTLISNRLESQLQLLAAGVLGFALGTISSVLNAVLVIVLTFYMLLTGNQLWHGLLSFLPPRIKTVVQEELHRNFQQFFISQILLGLFMLGSLAPIFLVLEVPFGLLFALLIGSSELIPFIGATIGISLVTLLVALQDLWLALRVVLVAVALQQIKDNLIAPRLLGSFTGLNPVWIFVALLVGAQVGGLLGVILAVPVAGTLRGLWEALLKPLAQPPEPPILPKG
ncbi:AI-2E family transporter [Leptolyngbya sp. FACHB-261]|uniref:AI-2E family transporter n=1 Tax=Leptolyngbya sp. FACHB-261 TaxID=2692806 RepID=UPI0016840D28|nr:AI-2E family transporter [Leptolyngbya sp. FACHB-261]MBD2101198.1 AI-2E family transporter [Leptolyngbya sp. FACHB-261]